MERANHEYMPIDENDGKSLLQKKLVVRALAIVALMTISFTMMIYLPNISQPLMRAEGDFSQVTEPYSVVDPASLGLIRIFRDQASRPSEIFGDLRYKDIPLPTNSWCENFMIGLGNKTDPTNAVFQLPYIVEAFDMIKGIRTHPVRVQANDRMVMMINEEENGLTLGAVEEFLPHEIAADKNLAIGRLSIVLQYQSQRFKDTKTGPMMYTPIVRGSPYVSMVYSEATPRIYMQRSISHDIIIDNNENGPRLKCGFGHNVFSETPVLVKKELKLQFEVSDMTWLVFVSEPTYFVCSNLYTIDPSVKFDPTNAVVTKQEGWEKLYPHFDLRAVNVMRKGMIRIAMVNNCTTGKHHAKLCDQEGVARDTTEYEAMIRKHKDIYATGNADIEFVFPAKAQEEDELLLQFNWAPGLMSRVHTLGPDQFVENLPDAGRDSEGTELLMYAIPHHQERMRAIAGSSNRVLDVGCTPTLHGMACPVVGMRWGLIEHLHRVSFQAPRAIRSNMLPLIQASIEQDIEYELPINYMRGAGDTYFSGKMLSKLARILIIADEIGYPDTVKFNRALVRLKEGVEIWLNGSAKSPLLYDRSWGGLVMCGCDYDGDEMSCHNSYPDCPALQDQGHNFGAGFYNDHHFHFGYHIYAAAAASKLDRVWGREQFERVLLYIRDIANPSPKDPYFPTWRHKDWYLGFSWASGIVTARGKPYPNGRNQESVSESISAYEAVAIYGDVMAEIFSNSIVPNDIRRYHICTRINDMGRLLFATETRSAKTYWHVQSRKEGVPRIYPDVYNPKIVGMVWSMLAQQQTWFGNEPYKSYGIQLLPITAGTELRDTPAWVEEMLPLYNQSCSVSPSCISDGWEVLIVACLATLGRIQEALDLFTRISDDVYDTAGGNGHSKSNTLWYIATRPYDSKDGDDSIQPN